MLNVDQLVHVVERVDFYSTPVLFLLGLKFRLLFLIFILQSTVKFLLFLNVQYKSRGPWDGLREKDVALVTGGSHGLGLEISKDLLLRGLEVHNLDVEESELMEDDFHFHQCDLGQKVETSETVAEIIQDLKSQGRRISVVVNNAGIRHSEPLLELSNSSIERIFNINTFAQIWINKLVLGSRDDSDKLFIVSVSSILGVLAPRNLSAYSATKAANISIHESLTQELRHMPQVRLLLVLPGQLDTRMFEDIEESSPFLAPLVDHRELAAQIVRRISRGERGVLCAPLYANFLPIIRALPIVLQDIARWLSGMDQKIANP